jgi:hypothetical protein
MEVKKVHTKLILWRNTIMQTKFNLGSIDVKVPAGADNPEINISFKDVSFEVNDLSLTEYGMVLKSLITETSSVVRDFHDMKESAKREELALRHQNTVDEMKLRQSFRANLNKDFPMASQPPLPTHKISPTFSPVKPRHTSHGESNKGGFTFSEAPVEKENPVHV